MTKRWTATRSGVQPKRLASKRARLHARRWAVVDDNDIYEIALHHARRYARAEAKDTGSYALDGKFRVARVTITEDPS